MPNSRDIFRDEETELKHQQEQQPGFASRYCWPQEGDKLYRLDQVLVQV